MLITKCYLQVPVVESVTLTMPALARPAPSSFLLSAMLMGTCSFCNKESVKIPKISSRGCSHQVITGFYKLNPVNISKYLTHITLNTYMIKPTTDSSLSGLPLLKSAFSSSMWLPFLGAAMERAFNSLMSSFPT